MIEVNVNRLITELEPSELSGSIAERGVDAGKETWENSCAAVHAKSLGIEDKQAVRDWAGEFGAWEKDEIASWSDEELDALVLQYAAGDLRELQGCYPGKGLGGINWKQAEKGMESGRVSGNLFCHNGELWIQLS